MPPYAETRPPVGRCAHTPPHIASTLGEVDSALYAEDGGVKISDIKDNEEQKQPIEHKINRLFYCLNLFSVEQKINADAVKIGKLYQR